MNAHHRILNLGYGSEHNREKREAVQEENEQRLGRKKGEWRQSYLTQSLRQGKDHQLMEELVALQV